MMLRYRRQVIAALSVAAVVASVGGAQAATHKRIVHKQSVQKFVYKAPEGNHTFIGGPTTSYTCGWMAGTDDCIKFTAPSWAKYLTITATDDHTGKPIGLSLWVSKTNIDPNATETFVCGGVKSMPITRGSSYGLNADTVAADPSCPAVATTGVITVTIRNWK